MLFPVILHPVAERRLVYVQLSGNMRNRLRSLYHHLGGFLLELRRKLPAIPGHSIPFLSRRILWDPLSGNRRAPHQADLAVLAKMTHARMSVGLCPDRRLQDADCRAGPLGARRAGGNLGVDLLKW